MTAYVPQITCADCGQPAAHPTDWHCAACGGTLEIANLPAFDASAIDTAEWSLWRYAAMLPVKRRMSLGEGMTPLVSTEIDGQKFRAKLEYLNPTGSYKDRGTFSVVNHLLGYGVTDVVIDSSGNAGSSLAGFGSAAGMRVRVFVPANATAAKKRQISMSAEVVPVEGPRQAVTDACIAATKEGATQNRAIYASHAWSPFFNAGQMTAAWEIWEQSDRRAPDAILVPLGQGCLFLGLYMGFTKLHEAGLIDRLPRLFAVQTAASDPIVRALESGQSTPERITTGTTVADGIVIGAPVRGKQIIAAIKATNGGAIRVQEDAILPARDALAKRGLFCEPTSATTYAALPAVCDQLDPAATIVLMLTGHGLKSSV